MLWYSLIVISLAFLQVWQANKLHALLSEYTDLLEQKEWIENTHRRLLAKYSFLSSPTTMEAKFKEAGFVIPTLSDIVTITSQPLQSTQTTQTLPETETIKEHFFNRQTLAAGIKKR